MTDFIRVTVDDRTVLTVLGQLVAASRDLRPALSDMGAALVASTQARFRAQQAPSGAAWAPLAPSTVRGRRKGKGAGSAQALLDTGRLRNSITRRVLDRTALLVGTNVEYAAVHQFGHTFQRAARSQYAYFRQDKRTGEVGRRFVKKSRSNFKQGVTIGAHAQTIPARPFLGLSASDETTVLGILTRHLAQAVRG